MNGTKICTVDGCGTGGYITRGWCSKHYARWRKHGDVNTVKKIVNDVQARFWSKVNKAGNCWEWTAGTDDSGYGTFMLEGKLRRAHVVSLEMETGTSRPDGMDTCHRCDNPPCVRPSHLYFGTRQQNMDDAWARSRFPIGENRPAAKVAELDVVAIRNEYADGAEVDDLVRAYGLKNSTIRGIVLGYKWKHAGGPITHRRNIKQKKVA